MSAAKKHSCEKCEPKAPKKKAADSQEILRTAKIKAEHLRESLQKSIMDNPKTAKKAAVIISTWIENKKLKR